MMMVGEFNGEKVEALAELSLGATDMAFVMLSHFGGPILSAAIDDHGFQQSRTLQLPGDISPERLLIELQLALFDSKQLQHQLQPDASVQFIDGGSQRQILWRGDVYIVIEYRDRSHPLKGIRIQNMHHNYWWQLQPMGEAG